MLLEEDCIITKKSIGKPKKGAILFIDFVFKTPNFSLVQCPAYLHPRAHLDRVEREHQAGNGEYKALTVESD